MIKRAQLKDRQVLENTSEPRRILFAASTGGHLAQLRKLSERMNATSDSVWVTFDSPQSRSLLSGKNVVHVPYVSPRDFRGTALAHRIVSRRLGNDQFDLAVSTGAALAAAVLPQMRWRGVPTYYIESVSRIQGPSLTGRLMAAGRFAELRTQHAAWKTERWIQYPSVLSQFRSGDRVEQAAPRRVFVTLGTIRPYRFDSLIDGLLREARPDIHWVWQLGETGRDDLPGDVYDYMSADDFEREYRAADVVVTHAGVGTILSLLQDGIHPVVVPRRKERGEHVDNHQEQITTLVKELNVGTAVEADGDLLAALDRAARLRVINA